MKNASLILAFLFAIFRDRNVKIHFRTLSPKDAKGALGVPAWKMSATIEQLEKHPGLLEELDRRNEKQGIYFVVNSGGDTNDAITKFNAVFVENDTRSLSEQYNDLLTGAIPPSIMVETRRSIHAYWLLHGPVTRIDWTNAQERLIARFQGDQSITKPAGLMRLPYFDHISIENERIVRKPVTALMKHADRSYTITHIFGCFPEPVQPKKTRRQPGTATSGKIKEGGRNNALTSKAGSLHRKGFSPEAVEAALIAENDQVCEPPLPVAEVREITKSVTSYPRPDHTAAPNEISNGLRELKVIRLDEVKAEKFEWLWNPYIPFGTFTLLDGEEGKGKTAIALSLATGLAVGKGISTVDSFEFLSIEPADTLILSAEDSVPHVLKPRLLALGAELSRIHVIDEPFSFDAEGLIRLRMGVAKYGPKLVIIDPLFGYAGRINLNNDNEVRSITRELARIASVHGCAIVGIRHLNKSKGMGVARAAGLNGVGWAASARSVLLAGQCAVTGNLAIAQYKTNISKRDDRSWGFEIRPVTVATAEGESIGTSKLEWTGQSQVRISDMLATSVSKEQVLEETEAMGFLRLALGDGRRPVKDLEELANSYMISKKQLRDARLKLGISMPAGTIVREGFGKDAVFYWRLPDIDAQDSGNGQV